MSRKNCATQRVITRLRAANGAAVTREALLFAIYGDGGEPNNTDAGLRMMIANLRKRWGAGSIETIHGVGYRLNPDKAPKLWRIDDAHVVLARSPADVIAFREMQA